MRNQGTLLSPAPGGAHGRPCGAKSNRPSRGRGEPEDGRHRRRCWPRASPGGTIAEKPLLMTDEALLQKLDTLPAQPGCYLFKDKKGEIVYVGKAKSLRSRVRSYFQESSGDERYFIPVLQRTVGDFETLVTASEKEAAILEDSLVKKHQPRYNVKLRDDKSYLCLRIRVD